MGNYFVTKTITYESSRDLPVEIAYNDSVSNLLAKRNYSYDSLGRVVSRTQTRGAGTPRSDAFGYNSRSELTTATIGNDSFAYNYDNIGNRNSATEAGTVSSYSTNNLNQYQAIVETVGGTPSYFTPIHDADGNAILVRTSTGVWQISYNAENRPVRFENVTTQTIITCAYDSQGRRFEKKVSVAGTTTLWERYLYRDYLQVAAFDITESAGTLNYSLKRVIYWDPSEPVATRPLLINLIGDQLYFPTVDLTKNVCELIDVSGTLAATYDYAPFGAATSTGTVANPLQWSSEIYDSELGLVYYNYRHYSPYDGRFLSRDPIEEQGGWNLYAFVFNRTGGVDTQGLSFLDQFKDAAKLFFLPGTVEFNLPITPVWGIFINLIFKHPHNNRQEVEVAGGASWNVKGKVVALLGRLPNVGTKFASYVEDYIPNITVSVWLSGTGSYGCGCIDVREVALSGAITAGHGRRGSTEDSFKKPDKKMEFGFGISGEISGILNLCNGTISLDYTLVASVNLNLNFVGWTTSYNRDFEQEGSIISSDADKNPWILLGGPIELLKIFPSCS
ncbi:MAG: RHS repeat-associated core domain-containing protein [Opitutales bacterium]|nr:RHS repeat-associated core domain-containing protein [Opitutales bacterium]